MITCLKASSSSTCFDHVYLFTPIVTNSAKMSQDPGEWCWSSDSVYCTLEESSDLLFTNISITWERFHQVGGASLCTETEWRGRDKRKAGLPR